MIDHTLAEGKSLIHGLNPEVRIICASFLSIAAALCDDIIVAMGYLAIGFFLILMTRLPWRSVYKRLRPLFWFLLMIWIFLPLTFGGEIVFQYKFIKASLPGLVFSCKITVKSVAILMVFTALIATIPLPSLGAGLHRLRVPDKMVFLLLMSYRYIAVIEDEYARLLRAAKFRGFKPRTNVHSYKTFAYLAGMLFVRASYRARRVYQAMLCRGFREKFHTLDGYPTNGLNFIFLILTILAGLCLVFIEAAWM